ncbi:MAG TPA: hypothetical protein VND41_00375 [Nitrososphaerales archaeon]|nr:hypothetical protein [Nitrososphaerales archaeon]
MRAIIHSIHSQVPETVSGLGERFDAVVSMDSHLDVSLGGDDSIYPRELRIIAARTGAHSALRNIAGGLSALKGRPPEGDAPEVIVVVPEAMLARHAMDIESKLPRSLRVSDQDESIASAVDFLAETMGIEVYPSPPRALRGLVRRVERTGSWLLDVDVDYMQEMQKECYTRIINPGPGVLQSMSRVIEFIQDSKPEIITISEAKVAAIRDGKSAFSAFIEELEAEGYKIEERGVFANDAEVVRAISVCKEFYRTVSRRLMLEHMDAMIRGDMEGFQKAEAVAARQFFRAKGYA